MTFAATRKRVTDQLAALGLPTKIFFESKADGAKEATTTILVAGIADPIACWINVRIIVPASGATAWELRHASVAIRSRSLTTFRGRTLYRSGYSTTYPRYATLAACIDAYRQAIAAPVAVAE